jgi:hypothetical protein
MKAKTLLLTAIICLVPSACLAKRAGVLVVHRNGEVKSSCVEFSDNLSGVELLERAEFKPKTDRNFVVEIDGESAENGWVNKSSNEYWFYWNRFSADWQYSHVGAASYQVRDGELDGWQIGGGQSVNPALEKLKFSDVCKATTTPEQAADAIAAPTSSIPSATVNQSETERESVKNTGPTTKEQKASDLSTTVKDESKVNEGAGVVKGEKTEDTTKLYIYIISALGALVLGFVGYQLASRMFAR